MRRSWQCLAATCSMLLIAACGDGGAPVAPASDDRTPVASVAVAGDGQTAEAGAAVAVPPAIRITDRAGRGVPGLAAAFEVTGGGGIVVGANQVSNGNGIATVGGWTMGAAGPQQLVARSPGLPAVTFSAVAAVPAGAPLMAGLPGTDGQTGTAGRPLAKAPAVRLTDGRSAPSAGIVVTFAVASGNGSVGSGIAVSDSAGIATAERWTLGAEPGEQTLTARADGFPAVTFRATAVAAAELLVARTTVVAGLSNPWDIAFTPDGWMLFTERGRGLSARSTRGEVTRRLFGTAGSLLVAADLVAEDQSGMLGVAVDPDFAVNRYVYVYMASTKAPPAAQGADNRVVRLTVSADYTHVADRVDIVTGISYAGGAHSGGRIKFGPDGYLYITTGDNRIGELPQDLRALGGKVLRVDRDGNPAPGNSSPAAGDPRIYTFGHRNPQGIDFRPAGFVNTGRAYTGEHGPGHDDEVTPLTAGRNAGWDPLCRPEGAGYCGYSRPTPMTDLARFPDALRPLWQTGGFEGRTGRSEGMADVAFLSGRQWGNWDGALAVALLAGMRMEVLRVDESGTALAARTALFVNLQPRERIRALELGPDGALYASTDSGEIWRIAPM